MFLLSKNLLAVILVSLSGALLQAQPAARVTGFSPRGAVKQVRQVRATFSQDMVAFGDPRPVADPFTIQCPVPGRGLWADTRNWVYDFESDLGAGVECQFQIRGDLRTLAGGAVQGPRSFSFSTGGPAVVNSIPYQGSSAIEESQAFLLLLDAPAQPGSVNASVYFTVEGLVEKIPVETISGQARLQVVQNFPWMRQASDDQLLLIQPKRAFPQSSQVNLVWGAGVRSSSGVETTEDQVLPFHVRPEFTATFSCQRENFDEGCIPFSGMQLSFSAPVPWDMVAASRLEAADGRVWRPVHSEKGEEVVHSLNFEGPFPERTQFTLHLPEGVRDETDRNLMNQSRFPLQVGTGNYPPLAKFAADFGIIEAKEGGLLPVTVRNIEADLQLNQRRIDVSGRIRGRTYRADPSHVSEILGWLQRLRNRTWDERGTSVFSGVETDPSYFRDLEVPRSESVETFEVLGIPLGGPGFYVTEIESQLLGEALLDQQPIMYVPAAALVTNLGVHLKWGIESSLVWVTQLSSGKPVSGARVEVWDCRSQLLAEGVTDKQGVALFSSGIPVLDEAERCSWGTYDGGLMATARTQDDFSFVHSDWNEGIERWRFSVPTAWDSNLTSAHTVLDRSLFRAGETVHMKHLIRRRSTSGFELPDGEGLPDKLEISHQGSDQTYQLDLSWDSPGSAVSEWEIPGGALRGTYSIALMQTDGDYFQSGSFQVQDFRVPLMKTRLKGPAEDLIQPEQIPLDISVSYFSGGGAGLLPVSVRYRQEDRSLSGFEGFEDFHFGNGRVKEGTLRSTDSAFSEPPPGVKRLDLRLDQQGTARVMLETSAQIEVPGQLRVELEYRDPNGEVQTASSSLPVWPARYLVGIKPDSWALSPEMLKFQVAVVDLKGKAVQDVPVAVELFSNQTFSHRKRLVGGFYAYEHVTEVARQGTICEGRTNRQGLVFCEAETSLSGSVLLQASAQDGDGRQAYSNQDVWVAGEDSWWFRVEDNDRIDMLPEQHRYEPGDNARFQIRMPFEQATALVSVEREGIIDTYVRRISRNKPVIEIPVLPHYAPNVFVSALVVRGRAAQTPPTTTVDLGKPAYKLGLGEIKVGWQGHELQVEAYAPREVFQVRETVPVQFKVRPAQGGKLPAGAELAVAAVDEGLLALQPNTSWNLLQAMMGQRGLGVQTSTAQMQVVGKRHFGLKALPTGGGGGQEDTRELFDTLLHWKARVPLDSKGVASVEIPLNDSLTSFRIVAIATAGDDLFGTGGLSIRTTQDLMIFSGIPPLVRQGDRFSAIFTIRNATDREINTTLDAEVTEPVGRLEQKQLKLGPSESQEVVWEVTAPLGVNSLSFDVAVHSDSGFSDRIRVEQQVLEAVPVRTFQATLQQLDGTFQLPVRIPGDALPNRGGVDVLLQSSLTASLDGVREYMRWYPYTCLEQQVSQSISLGDTDRWERVMASLPAFIDSDGLAKYFASSALGSDILTSYVLSISAARGWPIPPQSLERMLDGLSGFVEGRVVRYGNLPTTDLTLRKLSALEALSRYGRATTAMASVISVQPSLWPTSGLIDWLSLLSRLTDYPDRDRRSAEVEQQLRTRLTFRGTTMGFSTEDRDGLWWLMISSDVNSLRLVLTLLEQGMWREELPRLMVGAVDRMERGHWDLTTANSWGVLATEKFAAEFERIQITGETRAELGSSQPQSLRWVEQPTGGTFSFDWPTGQDRLNLQHAGGGRPWSLIRSRAAIPLREPLWSGYTVKRIVEPVQRKSADRWSVGDIVRIRLEMEAQADNTWVVVSDPIPAGASILGTGLASDSVLARQGERSPGRVWPDFQERTFDSFRSYYSYVPKGAWSVEYTLRLNNPGQFSLPPTRIEAMYRPEVFGELPNSPLEVQP